MKKKLKKKLPFYGRAYGGAARARADRKAYRRGGSVKASTTELLSPNEPKAPASGKVEQHFKKGGVAKRADGGPSDSDAPTKVPRSSSVADLTTAGLNPLLPALGDPGFPMGAGVAAPPAAPAAPAAPGPVMATPPPVSPAPGMRRGGGVKKRQEGGPTDEERAEGQAQLKRKMTSPLGEKIGRYQEAQSRNIVDTLRPRGFGGRAEPALRKDGGVLSAAQRQSLPKSDFALPGRGSGPKGAGSGSYPIPDRGHAKAALSRGAANASPAEQATIKRKVKAKYPDMDVS